MNEANVVDLELVKEAYNQKLNESKSDIISFWIHAITSSIKDNNSIYRLKGDKSEISSLIKAIGFEKRFISDVIRYGSGHPTAEKTKALLRNSIDEFTSKTKIPWPFKD